MRRVVQDRGVLAGLEGDIAAETGLQAEFPEGPGAGDEGVQPATAVAHQIDPGGVEVADRDLVAQAGGRDRFGFGLGVESVFEPEGNVGKAVGVVENLVELEPTEAVLGGDERQAFG